MEKGCFLPSARRWPQKRSGGGMGGGEQAGRGGVLRPQGLSICGVEGDGVSKVKDNWGFRAA